MAPSRPAAVLIHSAEGTCRTLCLDFDASSEGGTSAVLADVHTVSGLLHSVGAAWIRDASPSGGRHLYVPLAEPLPFHVARELIEALALIAPTLDPSPHRGIRHGCIRVPGSVHRTGGVQRLEMDLADAVDVATHPNGPDAIERLRTELSEQRALVKAARTTPTEHQAGAEGTSDLPVLPAHRHGMSTDMLRTATDGTWNRDRYSSASEARQAVLVSAVAAGLRLTDVQRRMGDGTWPGLAQFYSRYSPTHRQAALGRDWREAHRFVSEHTGGMVDSPVRRSNTSRPSTQGGASEYQFVRSWVNAVAGGESRYGNDRRGLTKRMLLRALAEAAMKTGSRVVAFGVRALAVAVGTDAGTISRHLKELAGEHTPLLQLMSRGRGVDPDTYQLVIPEELAHSAGTRSWRPGKIHALRPVFRELGVPEALVFEALEQAGGPVPVRSLVESTGLSRTAVNDAVTVMRSWGLITGAGGQWCLSPTADLDALAERLGCHEQVAEQLARYRTERLAWHAWLQARAAAQSAGYLDDLAYASVLWELTEPPPDPWMPVPLQI